MPNHRTDPHRFYSLPDLSEIIEPLPQRTSPMQRNRNNKRKNTKRHKRHHTTDSSDPVSSSDTTQSEPESSITFNNKKKSKSKAKANKSEGQSLSLDKADNFVAPHVMTLLRKQKYVKLFHQSRVV